MRKALTAAAIYYFVLGLSAIFWPQAWYALSGIHPTDADVLISSLGAVMLALACGALVASLRPQSQWGIVVVLFLANVFDGLVVLQAIARNQLSQLPGIGFIILDLIWLVVLGSLLYRLHRPVLPAVPNA